MRGQLAGALSSSFAWFGGSSPEPNVQDAPVDGTNGQVADPDPNAAADPNAPAPVDGANGQAGDPNAPPEEAGPPLPPDANAPPPDTGLYSPGESAPPPDPQLLKDQVRKTLLDMRRTLIKVAKEGDVLAHASEKLGTRSDRFADLSTIINSSEKLVTDMRMAVAPIQAQLKKIAKAQQAANESSMGLPLPLLPFVSPPPGAKLAVPEARSSRLGARHHPAVARAFL